MLNQTRATDCAKKERNSCELREWRGKFDKPRDKIVMRKDAIGMMWRIGGFMKGTKKWKGIVAVLCAMGMMAGGVLTGCDTSGEAESERVRQQKRLKMLKMM